MRRSFCIARKVMDDPTNLDFLWSLMVVSCKESIHVTFNYKVFQEVIAFFTKIVYQRWAGRVANIMAMQMEESLRTFLTRFSCFAHKRRRSNNLWFCFGEDFVQYLVCPLSRAHFWLRGLMLDNSCLLDLIQCYSGHSCSWQVFSTFKDPKYFDYVD